MTPSEEPAAPTADELEQATQVSKAAARAIAESQAKGGSEAEARQAADTAIKNRAQQIQMRISPEDRTAIVDELIERLNALGAFDPAPAAPAPAGDAQPAPEVAAEAAAEVQAAQAPPRKLTWAEKHFGGGTE